MSSCPWDSSVISNSWNVFCASRESHGGQHWSVPDLGWLTNIFWIVIVIVIVIVIQFVKPCLLITTRYWMKWGESRLLPRVTRRTIRVYEVRAGGAILLGWNVSFYQKVHWPLAEAGTHQDVPRYWARRRQDLPPPLLRVIQGTIRGFLRSVSVAQSRALCHIVPLLPLLYPRFPLQQTKRAWPQNLKWWPKGVHENWDPQNGDKEGPQKTQNGEQEGARFHVTFIVNFYYAAWFILSWTWASYAPWSCGGLTCWQA